MSEPTVVVSERAGLVGVAAGPARRWWILGVVGLAQLMVVLDGTIVNIALPSAQRDLGFSNADRQWVVTAYALAFGGLLLLGARLSDLVGRRRMLVIGLVGFGAASALGGAASSFAVRLLPADRRDPAVRIDWPGTVLVVGGLVAVVYGLSEADIKGWGAPATIVLLAAGVVLLAAFVLVEQRVAHPLLPPRIVLNRFRGGAYLAIGLSAIGVFGVFLFLTYYLQLSLGYSPVKSGVAFLPMIAALVAASTISSGLMPRVGPRPLIPLGLLIGAGGLVILAAQLGLRTSYPDWILPAQLLLGVGLGVVFGCALNTATYDIGAADAGVASALVNTNQQVGGSIGTALLNTIAASALTSYLVTHGHSPLALAGAAVHSYVVAFWVSAGIFAASAVVCALVLPSGTLAPAVGQAASPVTVTREEMSVSDR